MTWNHKMLYERLQELIPCQHTSNSLFMQQIIFLHSKPRTCQIGHSCVFLIFFLEGRGGWELDGPWVEALGWGRSGHSRS